MNFNSHIQIIHKELIEALACSKEFLIKRITEILTKVASLLKITYFTYWLKRIEQTSWQELPITNHAIIKVRIYVHDYTPNRKKLAELISYTCELLFTFWKIDDTCERGGQFFYYRNQTTKTLFKESGFGLIEGINPRIEDTTYIATIADLQDRLNFNDWYQ